MSVRLIPHLDIKVPNPAKRIHLEDWQSAQRSE
jgi:hypothetical protein